MKTFYTNQGPFDLNYLLKLINNKEKINTKKSKVTNIATLDSAKENEITFFENIKYKNFLNNSKASYVLISKKHYLLIENKNLQPIISANPLLDFIIIAKAFYSNADFDDNDISINKKYEVFLKKNILIDKSVEIGKNVTIGPNSSIKKNVKIGNNVKIGSNCSISNSLIEDDVVINDGTVIGKIGFGFKFINGKMIFIPHIGCVIINKSVYIGSNCTIDRGSFSNTIIGSGTMLDNQVHIAHNCKIGTNCFIAGQVGIAGSSTIGNNCMIGGQSGISGHLNIGDNVYIGGGSGVLNNIENKKKIMGYPATSLKNFLNIKKND